MRMHFCKLLIAFFISASPAVLIPAAHGERGGADSWRPLDWLEDFVTLRTRTANIKTSLSLKQNGRVIFIQDQVDQDHLHRELSRVRYTPGAHIEADFTMYELSSKTGEWDYHTIAFYQSSVPTTTVTMSSP